MTAGNVTVQRLTIQQIIASGNIDTVIGRSPVSAAGFHGVSGAHDLSENWLVEYGLTPLAPTWVHSRVRVQQRLHFQEFSEVMHEVTGWGSRDKASKNGQGSAVWRALGYMASHPNTISLNTLTYKLRITHPQTNRNSHTPFARTPRHTKPHNNTRTHACTHSHTHTHTNTLRRAHHITLAHTAQH